MNNKIQTLALVIGLFILFLVFDFDIHARFLNPAQNGPLTAIRQVPLITNGSLLLTCVKVNRL